MRFIPDIGVANVQASEPAKIDAIDKKLLIALAKDARQSLSQLARHARIGKDSTRYRINRMTTAGVIHPARMLADVGMLGYDSYHVFLQLKNPTPQVESQIVKKLSALPFVRAVLKFFGQYDFEVAIIAKNVREFDDMLTQIIEMTQQYLQRHDTFVITKSYVAEAFPKSFGNSVTLAQSPITSNNKANAKRTNKSDSKMLQKKNKIEIRSLDTTDLAIIRAMRDNASQPLVAIGEKIKIHPDTITYRLRNLEKWLLLGYAPVISYAALGYTMYAVLCNIQHLDERKEATLKTFLQINPHILWGVKTVGRRNVLLYICVKKEEEYQQTITELRNTFPEQILDLDTLSAVAEYKYTLLPDILFSSQK